MIAIPVLLPLRPRRDDRHAARGLETPLSLLAACHAKIRKHLELARRLAYETGHSPEDIRAAAQCLARYFGVGLPMHTADEDLSIAPRLSGISPVLEITLDVLSSQHRASDPVVDWLVSFCDRIARTPEALASTRSMLAQTVELLAAQFDTHLELEEQVVFPAIERLPNEDQHAILREIRARREDVRPPRPPTASSCCTGPRTCPT